MNTEETERVRERLFLAFELGVESRPSQAPGLRATGESMMRQNLRRRHPEATNAEIEERLLRWLESRDVDE